MAGAATTGAAVATAAVSASPRESFRMSLPPLLDSLRSLGRTGLFLETLTEPAAAFAGWEFGDLSLEPLHPRRQVGQGELASLDGPRERFDALAERLRVAAGRHDAANLTEPES